MDLQRAQIAFTLNRGREAPPPLLRAAKQLEPLDTDLAGETYLDALLAAMFAGRWPAAPAFQRPRKPLRPPVPPLRRRGHHAPRICSSTV